MSEAELHILKARMHEGRSAKAARGELVMGLPRGFVMKPSGEVALDPDEEVQSTIRLVFAVFERRRSVNGLLHYLVDHDIQLPDRIRTGARKGEVRWNRPNRATLADMLRHPAHAGAVRPELPDAHHTWGLAAEGPRRKECFTERRPHSPGCRYPAARRSNPTCRAPGTMG